MSIAVKRVYKYRISSVMTAARNIYDFKDFLKPFGFEIRSGRSNRAAFKLPVYFSKVLPYKRAA